MVPPIVLVVLQGLFLLLLYLFVARVARAILRDTRAPAPARASSVRAAPRPAPRPSAPTDRNVGKSPPRELVVHLAEGRPLVLPLNDSEIRFGRDEGCTVQLSDPYVSERHARVYRAGDGWVIADMGSTNGTYLNRAKVTAPAPIVPGDQLGIGKTVVEVRK
ncbi:hypothetical protein BH23ACT8_BH23ACT8_19610 [soil metagenome]